MLWVLKEQLFIRASIIYTITKMDAAKKRKKYKQKATASKKTNADVGLDLLDVCQCDKTGDEASSSSESGSSSDTD